MSIQLTTSVGIDVSGRTIVLHDLAAELEAQGVPVPYGLTIAAPTVPPPTSTAPIPGPSPCPTGSVLFTYDAQGHPANLPPEALPVIESYTP